MDKRYEENRRVKNEIARAFFYLLKGNQADSISVSSITAKAGVSRMAYYRNFETKMDIIDYYLGEALWNDFEMLYGNDPEFYKHEYGVAFFKTMQKHRDLFLLLEERGYSQAVLNAFDSTNEGLIGDMPSNSIERYKLYCYSGASYNCMMAWLKSGCKESPEEMSNYMKSFFTEMADSK